MKLEFVRKGGTLQNVMDKFVPKRFLVGLHLKVKGTMVIFEGIFIDQDFKKRLLLRSGLTLHGWRGLRKEARTKCHAVSGVLL